MTGIYLHPVTRENFQECIQLRVQASQEHLVASNLQSLAEAKVNAHLHPFALYDESCIGYETPPQPMVGFVMYEIIAGVGFIQRLMIDQRYQGQGYGQAAMQEVIRRLVLIPDVRLIATSYRQGNEVAARLYQRLGFVPWDIAWAQDNPEEVFLKLKDFPY